MESPTIYHSYILRLWRIQDGRQGHWRVSLTHVETGREHGFADLETLVNFLKEEARLSPAGPPDETQKERNK